MEPETLRRVGLPTTRRTRRLFGRREAGAEAAPAGYFREDPTAPTGVLGRAEPGARPSRSLRLAQRAGAGLLAGGLVLGVLGSLGPDPSFSPAAAAGAAALATALLPRIGWMLSAFALCVWLVSPEADRQGTALVIAAAAAADPVPAATRRPPLVGSRGRAAARHRRARARLHRHRRAGADRLAPRRARDRRLLVARPRRGHHRRGAPVRLARRHPSAGRLGGLDLGGRVRRASAARHNARAGAARRLGGVRPGAAARDPRPLARRRPRRRRPLGRRPDRGARRARRCAGGRRRARPGARSRGGLRWWRR